LKLITRIIAEENVKPLMEKLTNIREKIRYGKKMNRRLQNMPLLDKNPVLHCL